tara:strand:- start:15966 stop:16415 length:450 start_codon:yes stop_codon:yes gene_type:complete
MILKPNYSFNSTKFSKWVFDNCYHIKPENFNFGFTDGDFMSFKSEKKTLRFIEHKYHDEKWSSHNQKRLFTYHLPNMSKIINKHSQFKQEIYIVITKENPFEGMLIYDCINKKTKYFLHNNVIKFMKFEVGFDEGENFKTPHWIDNNRF